MATIYLIAPLPILNCDVGDVYVGSTIKKLAQRLYRHKRDYKRWLRDEYHNCSSFRLFEKYGVDNCTIIEVERCDVENRYERESYWIGYYDGVNQNNPIHNRKECDKQYYEQNKEQIAEYQRQYREQNKERITEYQRQYYTRKKAEQLASKSNCIQEV